LTDKFEALPFSIFYLAAEHRTAEELNRGFGSALLLLILTALLFQAANWFHGRIAKGWR
jgi:phosphate transport system permease protein